MDWQEIKKHLADPDLEKVFDKTPDQEPLKDDKVEKETESPTAPDATASAAHDEL